MHHINEMLNLKKFVTCTRIRDSKLAWRLQKVNGLETSSERGAESWTLTREERRKNAVNSRGAAVLSWSDRFTSLRSAKVLTFLRNEYMHRWDKHVHNDVTILFLSARTPRPKIPTLHYCRVTIKWPPISFLCFSLRSVIATRHMQIAHSLKNWMAIDF